MKKTVHLSCEGLTKKYTDKTVVSEVSIKVDTGKVVGLLGPNGAPLGPSNPTTFPVSTLMETSDTTVLSVYFFVKPSHDKCTVFFISWFSSLRLFSLALLFLKHH